MNTQTQTDEVSAEVGDAAARQVTPGPPLQPGVATRAGRWGNDAAAAREAAGAATGAEAAAAAAGADGVGVIARTDENISEKHPEWHDSRGKFRPGNPGGHGKQRDKLLIHAIQRQFPPETVAAMLQAAYDRAEERNSWRGQLEIARLVIEYTIGKPVRRSISVSTKLDSILSRLEHVDTSSEIAGMVIDSVAEEPDGEG